MSKQTAVGSSSWLQTLTLKPWAPMRDSKRIFISPPCGRRPGRRIWPLNLIRPPGASDTVCVPPIFPVTTHSKFWTRLAASIGSNQFPASLFLTTPSFPAARTSRNNAATTARKARFRPDARPARRAISVRLAGESFAALALAALCWNSRNVMRARLPAACRHVKTYLIHQPTRQPARHTAHYSPQRPAPWTNVLEFIGLKPRKSILMEKEGRQHGISPTGGKRAKADSDNSPP
jgi:hypothetical protein